MMPFVKFVKKRNLQMALGTNVFTVSYDHVLDVAVVLQVEIKFVQINFSQFNSIIFLTSKLYIHIFAYLLILANR